MEGYSTPREHTITVAVDPIDKFVGILETIQKAMDAKSSVLLMSWYRPANTVICERCERPSTVCMKSAQVDTTPKLKLLGVACFCVDCMREIAALPEVLRNPQLPDFMDSDATGAVSAGSPEAPESDPCWVDRFIALFLGGPYGHE